MEQPDATPLEPTLGAPVTGACAQAPAPGRDFVLEDFEDGDHQLFKVYEREGWWFSAGDGTATVPLVPPENAFRPALRLDEEKTADNQMAAHLVAPKMTDWGVSWGTTLRWVRGGVRCPFNGSAFAGFEFWAKGPATIVVKVGTSATVPGEFDGVCEKDCWDMHRQVVRIEEGWNRYVVRWSNLQQGGWGTDARFEPERLLTLNWTAGPGELPVDFWIDDVRFLSTTSAEPPAPAPRPEAASRPPEPPLQAGPGSGPAPAGTGTTRGSGP